MVYALSFIFLFCIGGLTGLMQGALAVNVHIHDTYFIVGHFHYVMFGGTGFAFFAAMLYWFPKMFGKMYDEKVAMLAWFPMFVGFNMLYFTMLFLGYVGMPRRYFDHLPQYHGAHIFASVGSFILAAGLVVFFGNFVVALFRGKKAEANPWGGVTLEWQIPSPPPQENFEEIPEIRQGPYVYNPEGQHDAEEER
jgi:cytochrome c oxidase subunit 1